MWKCITNFTIFLVSLIFCGGLMAQNSKGNLYFLGALGSASYSGNAKSLFDSALSRYAGLSSTSESSSTGYKLGLGYQFNPYIASEVTYLDLGTAFKYRATITGGWLNVDAKGSGMNFSVLGIAPINDQFSLFGKIGYTSATIKYSMVGAGGTASVPDEDKNSGSFGVGGIFKVTKTLGIRAEWDKLFSDVSLASIGLQVEF
jgi:OOP family OmpA-OmpF porin